MMSEPGAQGGGGPDITGGDVHLPAVIAKNEKTVARSFWRKVARVFAGLPFIDDLLAAYFCATDSATPLRVRAVLLAALAYFVLPVDLIPDFIAGMGFTDDATVLAAAVGLVSAHIRQDHRDAAAKVLQWLKGGAKPD